jgi:hypothetical protein
MSLRKPLRKRVKYPRQRWRLRRQKFQQKKPHLKAAKHLRQKMLRL